VKDPNQKPASASKPTSSPPAPAQPGEPSGAGEPASPSGRAYQTTTVVDGPECPAEAGASGIRGGDPERADAPTLVSVDDLPQPIWDSRDTGAATSVDVVGIESTEVLDGVTLALGDARTRTLVETAQTLVLGGDTEAIQSAEREAAPEWRVGEIILGLYQVTGLLGQGGMGLVFKVRHLGWNLDLAVKTPKVSVLRRPKAAKAFHREAETWVNLDLHPNVVSCYYVRDLSGVPRVFMEFVAGGTLKDWIQQKRLRRLDVVLDIAIQFAWGLRHAHKQGLIHRDVKPGNVMMTPTGIAKVTDFGLVQAVASEHGRAAVPNALTPAYCAPEQVRRAPVSHATDVWSWAVSVLEIFTGQVTWAWGGVAPQALEDHLRGWSDEQGMLPIPEELAETLRECFRDDPTQRPADLGVVVDRLKRVYSRAVGKEYPRADPSTGASSADTLNNRAISLLDLGRRADAERLWLDAMEREPQHVESTYNYGLVLWRTGRRTDDALLRSIEDSRLAYPHEWDYLYRMALIRLEQGDCQGAIRILEQVPDGMEQREEIQVALTLARFRLGRAVWSARRFDQGHTELIRGLALGGGTRLALSTSQDETVRLWDIASGTCLATLHGHTGRVLCGAMAAEDSTRACSGGEDHSVRLWDLATGEGVRSFAGHTGPVTAVAMTRDGRRVISCGMDGAVKLWDAQTGSCIRSLLGHDGPVHAVAITPGGTHAASGGADNTVRVWDLDNGRLVHTLNEQTGSVTALAVTPDGHHVLSGSWDGTVRLWSLRAGRCVDTLVGHCGAVSAICVGQESRHALSAGHDGTLRVWELEMGRCLRTLQCAGAVTAAALSPDSAFVIYADGGRQIRRWEIGIPGLPFRAPLMLSQIGTSETALAAALAYRRALDESVTLYARQEYVGAATRLREARKQRGYARRREAIRLWRDLYVRLPRSALLDGWVERSFSGHTEAIAAVHIGLDNRTLLSASRDRTIKLWDLARGTCLKTLEGHAGPVGSAVLSRDGRRVLSGSDDQTLKLWELSSGKCLRTFAGHGEAVLSVGLSRNGRYAVSASADKTLRLWSTETGACLNTFGWQGNRVTALRLTEDDRYVVSGGGAFVGPRDFTVRLWELATAKTLQTFEGHEAPVRAVDVTAATTLLASGGEDHSVRLWELASGKCLRVCAGHSGAVTAVRFLADGRFLASACADKTLKLWEVASGRCIQTFTAHASRLYAVDLGADGRFAATGGEDHKVVLWALDWELNERVPADWHDGARPLLEAFLNRRFTPTSSGTSSTPVSQPPLRWSTRQWQTLLAMLGYAGYGWLRPAGVQAKLERMAGHCRTPIRIMEETRPCTGCGARHQHRPVCLECGATLAARALRRASPAPLPVARRSPLGLLKAARQTRARKRVGLRPHEQRAGLPWMIHRWLMTALARRTFKILFIVSAVLVAGYYLKVDPGALLAPGCTPQDTRMR